MCYIPKFTESLCIFNKITQTFKRSWSDGVATSRLKVKFNLINATCSDNKKDNFFILNLLGGHTIGVSFCTSFATRIYNFTGRNDSDPSMDPTYVAALKRACRPGDTTTTVAMDPDSASKFDVHYYSILRQRKGLLQSDSALLDNRATSLYVEQHSTSSGTNSFFQDFAASMVKMGKIGVLKGKAGQIRKICSVANY